MMFGWAVELILRISTNSNNRKFDRTSENNRYTVLHQEKKCLFRLKTFYITMSTYLS